MSGSVDVAAEIRAALGGLYRDSGGKQEVFTIAQISTKSGVSRSAVTARLYPASGTHTVEDVQTCLADNGAKAARLKYSALPKTPLQELYNKFDGVEPSGNARLAWYGQCRAEGMSHDEAIRATYEQYKSWCREFWPKRGIELPS